MAPSVADKTAPASTLDAVVETVKDLKLGVTADVPTEEKPVEEDYVKLKYPAYYPHSDPAEKFPPLEVYEHVDPGLRADPTMPHLLGAATTRDLSPFLGTEIHGVQISQLSSEGLDELALFAGQRKVLIFRDQDFADAGYERQLEIAGHFGRVQQHPTSANVKGRPEFHVVYRDGKRDFFNGFPPSNMLSRTQWHSDVSYEKQPAGTTLFMMLQTPLVGGDTHFASQVEAYKRLSFGFRKRLEGLKAMHSAFPQAEGSRRRGGPVRREPIETIHPVVRQHPVTGEKALYVNNGFTKSIVGYKQEESDNLLKFLFDHIAKGTDFQVRATYAPRTLVVWDNRVTCHSATSDYDLSKELRHAVRLTPQGEVPFEGKPDTE